MRGGRSKRGAIEESDRAGATARNFVETGDGQGSGSASSSSGIRVVSQGSDEGLAVQWVKEIQQVVKENIEVYGDEPNVDEDWGLEEQAIDDVNGGSLPVGLVKEARREEVEYINSRGIWVFRPIEECINRTGKKPISMRWVDTNKGIRLA